MWWWLVATWLLVQAQASMDDGCIEGFVVHRDKIIRTEDSKNMGAKFLSELEVENRQECMSWCCDTQRCDVFIFEEKKPGSCYLFHCGPPHDFKCKFTSHANYSSAVLQNYADLQNADELEEEIRRTQHEHQLKSLRKPEPPSREYDYFVTNPPPPRLTDPPTTPSTTTTTTVRGSKCSRNQFECRSNDDCIAIYNVCDGIPQCPDGSDEAAEELGCPTVKTTLPPPPPPPPLVVGPSPRPAYVPHLPDFIRYQQQMLQEQQHAQQYPMLYPSQDGINKDWVNQLRHPQHQDASYDPAVSYGAPPNGYKLDAPPQSPVQYQWNNNYDPGIIYEQQQQQQQQQHQQRQQSHGKDGDAAARAAAAAAAVIDRFMHDPRNSVIRIAPQPEFNEQDPQSPHIFNHKPPNPGIRVQDDTEAQNAGYPSNQQLYPYDNQMHSWQGNNNPAPTQAPPAPTTSSAPPRPTQPPPCDPNEKHDKEVTPAKEKPAPVAAVVHQSAAPGGASRHPESKQSAPVGAEKVSKPDVDSHKAHAELDHHADQPPLAAHQQQQNNHVAIIDHVRRVKPVNDDFDGMSRPKIAIISLALGLSVTTVMIVLIASTCRLKVVKRRGGRRGGRDSGADDYLVNGMYL